MPAINITDLSNAKLDVDHIAAIATSNDTTVTDRLGNTKATVKAAIDSLKAFNSRGAWAAATVYAVKDLVLSGGVWYVCVTAHTSSAAFATDSASKWRVHQGLTGAELAAAGGANIMEFNPATAYAANTTGNAIASALKGNPGRSYSVCGYVLRNDGSGWACIDDVDHRPTNIASVSVIGDDLRVTYSGAGVRVVSHQVSTDETMAAMGMLCGPSVGLTYSNIKLYMPFACWVEKTAGSFAFGASDGLNPWFGPGTDTTISTSADQSSFTITHKTASGSHPPVMTVLTQSSGGGASPGADIRISYGGTTIIGTAHSLFEGLISYNAGTSTWDVDTPNIAKPSCSFSSGVLTVTHENLGPDTRAVSVDAVSGIYLPASGATVSGTTFQVVFQDYAGANVTTANSNMKFRYMRPRQVKTKAPDGMRIAIQRGPVILNPINVISMNGNLWGSGFIEVT